MSRPLKIGIREMFNMSRDEWRDAEEYKDVPQELFFGLSYREMQINLSENWFKPQFGNSVLGDLAVRATKARSSSVVISDCGFEEEIAPIHAAFPENVCLIRIHRSGCDFTNDSRNYLPDGILDAYLVQDIDNKYDLEMFEVQLIRALRKWSISPREI